MKFRLIDQAKKEFPASRLCQFMGVGESGYFLWKDRRASRCQRDETRLSQNSETIFRD
nr:hypothetical protein [Brucella anthropi]